MSMEAKVKRLGGTPEEQDLRAAHNDLKTAEFAYRRALAEYQAQKANVERCEGMVARARARIAQLEDRVN